MDFNYSSFAKSHSFDVYNFLEKALQYKLLVKSSGDLEYYPPTVKKMGTKFRYFWKSSLAVSKRQNSSTDAKLLTGIT